MSAPKRSAASARLTDFGHVTKSSKYEHVPEMEDHQDGEDGEEEWGVAMGHTEDDLLALPAEQLNAFEFGTGPDNAELSADDAQVEVKLVDEDLDISVDELQKKASFYEAIEIPTSAEQFPADVFLQLLQGLPEIKDQVIAFAITCMGSDRDECPVPTNHFLRSPQPETWESYCPGSDRVWDDWLSECRSLDVPDHALDTAAKISGPLRANLNVVWHYPTWNVGRAMFGFTADSNSSCLGFQNRKIGPNPRVCTNDMIPIRAHFVPNGGVAWESLFPNAAEVLEKSVDLTMRLLDESRIVMVIGRQAHDTVTRRLEEDPTIEVHKLFVPAHGVTIFREAPHILVVRGRETQEIRNLVFFSHHSQSFFYCSDQRVGLYHDFLWNAACAIANVPVVGGDIFYRATCPKRSTVIKGKKMFGQLALAIIQRGREKAGTVVLPDAVVLDMFKPTIAKNSESWATNFPLRGEKTVLQVVIKLLSDKGRAKGNATHAAGGWQNCVKGRATQAAQNWPALRRGTETQRSRGFPNLKKARDSGGYKKGHATQQVQKLARIEAVLNAYQSRQLLAKAKELLTDRERAAVADLERFRDCLATGKLTPMCQKWRDTHVIYWSKKNPYGMRFKGDSGPGAPSSYDDRDHPCLWLYRQFNKKDKEGLAQEWKDGEQSADKSGDGGEGGRSADKSGDGEE